jgi:hypothetical protein
MFQELILRGTVLCLLKLNLVTYSRKKKGLQQIKYIFCFSVVRKYAKKSNGTEEGDDQNNERF